jgi:hypothetical protein
MSESTHSCVSVYPARVGAQVICWLLAIQLFLAGCGSANHASVSPTATTANNGVSLKIASQLTATAKPTLQPTAPLGPGNGLITAPGTALPSEAECAARVRRSSFEPRPQNRQVNQNVPTAQQITNLAPWDDKLGQSIQADTLRKQITGNFTGTTDEILQWAACKWGMNPDLVRAEAVIESYWRQSQLGDYTNDKTLCPPSTWDGKGCYQSYGILQIKYYYFQSTWPMNRDDTAFNAEYVYGVLRACYEGWTTYLSNTTPLPGYASYHAGDIWGCVGRWYSGRWYNQDAVYYIQRVKQTLANKTWLQTSF